MIAGIGFIRQRSTRHLRRDSGISVSSIRRPRAFHDAGQEFRRITLHRMLDTRPKLVPKIRSRIVTDSGAEVAGRIGRRPPPVGLRRTIRSDRSQRPQQIGGVQPASS
jgi:hypothetical protein